MRYGKLKVLGLIFAVLLLVGCTTVFHPLATEIPYAVLDRSEWLNYEDAAARVSIENNIRHEGTNHVWAYNTEILARLATNRGATVFLKPGQHWLPVENVQVRQEKGTEKREVLLMGNQSLDASVMPFASSSVKNVRLNAFTADLKCYRARYTFSIERLMAANKLDVDLRALPSEYRTFARYEFSSSWEYNARVQAGATFYLLNLFGSRSSNAQDSERTLFEDKVFAVGFLRSSDSSSFYLGEEAMHPLEHVEISLAPRNVNNPAFKSWNSENNAVKISDIIIRDARKNDLYKIAIWDRKQNGSSSLGDRFYLCTRSKYTGSDNTITIENGYATTLRKETPTLVPRLKPSRRIAPSVYDSHWVYYVPESSLKIVRVSKSWSDRRDFVEFVP